MPTKKKSLIDIAYPKLKKEPVKKEPTPKALREVEIRGLGDWLIWIEIAKEHSNKELVTEQVEANFLGIIQKQFTEILEMQKAMSKLMTNYTKLIANEKYLNHALSEIYRKLNQLEKIEKLTSKGGRRPNKELYEVTNAECISWFSRTGKKPSGGKLSQLVEAVMKLKKGSARTRRTRGQLRLKPFPHPKAGKSNYFSCPVVAPSLARLNLRFLRPSSRAQHGHRQTIQGRVVQNGR
jgi:hypothetical protein